MYQKVTSLGDDRRIVDIDVDGVGSVTVGMTPLPGGALSAYDPQSKILVIDQSLSASDRLIALSRWAFAVSSNLLACLPVAGLIS